MLPYYLRKSNIQKRSAQGWTPCAFSYIFYLKLIIITIQNFKEYKL